MKTPVMLRVSTGFYYNQSQHHGVKLRHILIGLKNKHVRICDGEAYRVIAYHKDYYSQHDDEDSLHMPKDLMKVTQTRQIHI
jgi:hypothetical protein